MLAIYNEVMQPDVALKLIDLNRRFYQSFAQSFSDTRQRLQPGVLQVFGTIPKKARILDLGCGNGNLALELVQRGYSGEYTGLDFSPKLLEIAKSNQQLNPRFTYFEADLGDPKSIALDDLQNRKFDLVLAFATLHHIPSIARRLQLVKKIASLLSTGKQFIHSNWQFLNSQKLSARIQDWKTISLSSLDVDEGDYLLDWRREGKGLRYVHHFDSKELEELADQTGFTVSKTFSSDGETGDLAYYSIWQKTDE